MSQTTVLTDTNSYTTTAIITVNTSVTDFPNSDFTYTPSDICMNYTQVIFKNTSTPAPSTTGFTYTWNFGDGTPLLTSNNIYVTHTYTQPGYFQVILQVTNICGQCDYSAQIIKVIPSVKDPSNNVYYNVDCCSKSVYYDMIDYTIPQGYYETWALTNSYNNHESSTDGDNILIIEGTLTIT